MNRGTPIYIQGYSDAPVWHVFINDEENPIKGARWWIPSTTDGSCAGDRVFWLTLISKVHLIVGDSMTHASCRHSYKLHTVRARSMLYQWWVRQEGFLGPTSWAPSPCFIHAQMAWLRLIVFMHHLDNKDSHSCHFKCFQSSSFTPVADPGG